MTPHQRAIGHEAVRNTVRRWSDRVTLGKLLVALVVGGGSGVASVWVAFGGSFTTPAQQIISYSRTSFTRDSLQSVDISRLKTGLEQEVAARRAGDSALEARQLENRYYLRMLALDRCITRKQQGWVPSQLEPYCNALAQGRDLPNPLRP